MVDNLKLALQKAISLLQMRDYDEAVKEFEKLLKLDDNLQPVYYYLGVAHLNEGRADKAIVIWNKGIDKFHPWPALDDMIISAYNQAGWINYKKGVKDKAYLCFEKAIKSYLDYLSLHKEIDPEKKMLFSRLFADACKYLGIMNAEKGLPQRAIPFFEKALELNMSIKGVKMRLKKALQYQNDKVEVDPILLTIPKLPVADSTSSATARSIHAERIMPSPNDWKYPYHGFAKEYSKSSYYQRESKIMEPFWNEECSRALQKANKKYSWHCWAYITDEIIKVLPPDRLKELKRCCNENGVTWYNAIMRYAMAKREQLKLIYVNPRFKTCKHCKKNFFEGQIETVLTDYLFRIDSPIEYCHRCLAAAFLGAHKTEKSIEALKQDLANLVQALGFIPPRNLFNNKNFVETIPKNRTNQVIPALITIAHPEVYEQMFGSWLNALIVSGTLNDDAHRLIFGTMCMAEDGHECRSLAEKLIDDWLYKNGLAHVTEPFYPVDAVLNPNGLMRADWQVEDFFIEYFGLVGLEDYEEKMKVKRRICEKHGIRLVAIMQEDLPNLNTKLQCLKR